MAPEIDSLQSVLSSSSLGAELSSVLISQARLVGFMECACANSEPSVISLGRCAL